MDYPKMLTESERSRLKSKKDKIRYSNSTLCGSCKGRIYHTLILPQGSDKCPYCGRVIKGD
jgi:hypothetical protein